LNGLKGTDGSKGLKGVLGEKGNQGKKKHNLDIKSKIKRSFINLFCFYFKGINGSKGNKGIDGKKGLDGIDGDKGIAGRPGEKGLNGERGEKGNKGLLGNKNYPFKKKYFGHLIILFYEQRRKGNTRRQRFSWTDRRKR
jgi:hypothetical protein